MGHVPISGSRDESAGESEAGYDRREGFGGAACRYGEDHGAGDAAVI